ncbi:hypothetical protein AN963_12120 [Brevibacillus choshinensis]|uniref:Uncharacterized protein n=1 Tax=Brevibacillus choshinensis TaxID=54911 RepID=A0ABR5N566_BRECH|nr:hypothetical protein AN963_12120 [Brevibacillus choshinensis]
MEEPKLAEEKGEKSEDLWDRIGYFGRGFSFFMEPYRDDPSAGDPRSWSVFSIFLHSTTV